MKKGFGHCACGICCVHSVHGCGAECDPYWLAQADECIRQMEWARADAGLEFEPGTDEVPPLTLAPEDWEP